MYVYNFIVHVVGERIKRLYIKVATKYPNTIFVLKIIADTLKMRNDQNIN